jgi:hypothetical protein
MILRGHVLQYLFDDKGERSRKRYNSPERPGTRGHIRQSPTGTESESDPFEPGMRTLP